MSAVRDFRIINAGSQVVLSLLDERGEVVYRLTMSWISGFRLMNEAAMAVGFGLLAMAPPARAPRGAL